jgi:hypothetical protein
MTIGRPTTPLNCEQPRVGCAFIIKNLKTKENVKCATASQRDTERRGSKIKVLRAFSGDEPFFMVKVGSLHTEIKVLKFLCGAQHRKCLDTTGEFLWTGITWKDAIKQGMEFSQPNLKVKDETPVKAKKVTKTRKPYKARKAKVIVEAPTEIVPEVVAEVIEEVTSRAPEMTDAEFEASVDADHQATLAKLQATSAQ